MKERENFRRRTWHVQRERHKVKSMAYSRKLSKFRVVGTKGSQSGEGEPEKDDSQPCKPQ